MQNPPTSAPVVPALTSVGFAHWEAILILAYPDEEWERLSRVVLDLPVEADDGVIDGKPERLPNQISRHLLPERGDHRRRKLFDRAILDLGGSNRRMGPVRPFEYPLATGRFTGQQESSLRERVQKTYDHGRESLSFRASSVSSFAPSSRPSLFAERRAPSVLYTGHGHRSISRDFLSIERDFLTERFKSMDVTSYEEVKPQVQFTYTCLLDTCTASCRKDCTKFYHSDPFRTNRQDKLKDHLRREHPGKINWTVPASWSREYKQTKKGWVCGLCGEFLGAWYADSATIDGHWRRCPKKKDEVAEPHWE